MQRRTTVPAKMLLGAVVIIAPLVAAAWFFPPDFPMLLSLYLVFAFRQYLNAQQAQGARLSLQQKVSG